jgi:hypothetical protein
VVSRKGCCLLRATQMYLIANKDVARCHVLVPEPRVQRGRAAMEMSLLQTSPVATASNEDGIQVAGARVPMGPPSRLRHRRFWLQNGVASGKKTIPESR